MKRYKRETVESNLAYIGDQLKKFDDGYRIVGVFQNPNTPYMVTAILEKEIDDNCDTPKQGDDD